VLPGGFSYGDYLRCGAMAAQSPIMKAVRDFAAKGGHVLGVCNGFQVLCEAHLLPGALVRNDSRLFVCRDQRLRVERADTAWTNQYGAGEEIVIPLKNGEGGFVADARTLDELEVAEADDATLAEIREIAETLLSNPVIEDFAVRIEDSPASGRYPQ
jgi:phosphoribosylformylglycinamidine synthase